MGNLELNAVVPWLSDMDGRKCFICKNGVEDAGHFFFDSLHVLQRKLHYLIVRLENYTFQWKIFRKQFYVGFSVNLDRKHKTMFLLGGLSLPFDSKTTTIVKRFVSTAVGKIYKLRSNKLRDLEAPWLKVK